MSLFIATAEEVPQSRRVLGLATRALLLLPLLGVACTAGDDHACTLLGCASGASFDLGAFPESDFARLTGATIEVCINGMCRDQVIDGLPPPNDIAYLHLGQGMDPRIEVTLARTDPSGAIEIQIEIASDQPGLFHDGDIYTATLVGSDAGSLVDRAWSVSYQTLQPNGPDCAPTCRAATTTTEL